MMVTTPVMNPVQPVIPNPVIPAPVEREGGGGTVTPTEFDRAVLNSEEVEQGRPDAARSQEEAIARQQGGSELAAQARLQAAREAETAPAGFGVDPAQLADPESARQAPASTAGDAAAAATGPAPGDETGRPGVTEMQERLESRIVRDMFPDPNRPAESSRFFDVT
ncbi:hypothetical protein [Ectothiorhodospira lacustris]|uniref:hypothetical protein n=1 Tax=Ectothiorhodospira lacustris TaxID=2899127 RepID=UPI001EE7F706|nr:hypothetical protein [Ectothiorhodospira lacustris]MCG5499392.1 hypothetical protein [Ectothiorhodospira lacustris]MCG5511303.1 hypothetical protein [Ectothiorhodospira lacustris]MCG5523031.1 hypothetical protein [Ectothiorhodospira lacustris]